MPSWLFTLTGWLSERVNRHTLLGIGRSKFSRDVLWNILSLGVLALGGVIVNLIIARFRGAEALGMFNQVFAVYIVLSQVGVGGLQFSVLKHVSYHQSDRAKCAEITTSALILATIISSLISIMGCFLAEPIGILLASPEVGVSLSFAMPGLLFFSLNKVLINALNGMRHMKAYAVFRAIRYIFIPISIFVIIMLRLPDPDLSLSLTIAELLLFVGLVAYTNMRLFPLQTFSNLRHWFSEHLSFGIRGVLSGVLVDLNTRVDVLMLGYFSTDSMVGVYSFAAILAEGFGQIPVAIRWNVDPIIGRYFAEGEKWKIGKVAKRIKKILYPIMGLIGVVSVLLYPVVLYLWVRDDKTAASWVVFAIIMASIVLTAGYRPFMGILLQGGRPGVYTLFIGGLVIGSAVLHILFIPMMGIYGAALVTALTNILGTVFLVICARKLFGIHL
jgi:O-antigen/teichoic acid export membrane protein